MTDLVHSFHAFFREEECFGLLLYVSAQFLSRTKQGLSANRVITILHSPAAVLDIRRIADLNHRPINLEAILDFLKRNAQGVGDSLTRLLTPFKTLWRLLGYFQ